MPVLSETMLRIEAMCRDANKTIDKSKNYKNPKLIRKPIRDCGHYLPEDRMNQEDYKKYHREYSRQHNKNQALHRTHKDA
jgi:hypothetical protein